MNVCQRVPACKLSTEKIMKEDPSLRMKKKQHQPNSIRDELLSFRCSVCPVGFSPSPACLSGWPCCCMPEGRAGCVPDALRSHSDGALMLALRSPRRPRIARIARQSCSILSQRLVQGSSRISAACRCWKNGRQSQHGV